MLIRNAAQITQPRIGHEGTVRSHRLINYGDCRTAVEFVTEIEIVADLPDHEHPIDEFFYVLAGEGIAREAGEEREVGPGDLIYTPPNIPHGMRLRSDSMRILVFAVSGPGTGDVDAWRAAREGPPGVDVAPRS